MVTKNRTRLQYEPRRDFAGANLTNAYQKWGTPLVNPCRIDRIVNLTNMNCDISIDGVTDHDISPSQSGAVNDNTASRNISEGAYFPAGTQFWVKSVAGAGTGSIYLVTRFTS